MSRADVGGAVLAARALYDRPAWNHGRAELRRAKVPGDLLEMGRFWELAQAAPPDVRAALSSVVFCFDAAAHRAGARAGATLRRALYPDVKLADLSVRAVRFRRLLAASDRDDFAHQLRRLLRHGSQRDPRFAIDWEQSGSDLVFFGDAVRRRWAESFYTATTRVPVTEVSA